jgi:hypothetical protein
VKKTALFMAGCVLAFTLGFSVHAKVHAQATGDDLSVALINHGIDPQMGPPLATVIELAIANANSEVGRITALEGRMAAVESKLNPPAPAAKFMLAFSTSAADTNGLALQGATLKGSVAVFTALVGNPGSPAPQGNIFQVNYSICGVTATGCIDAGWPNIEKVTPFDFAGGVLWSTMTPVPSIYPATNGQYRITQMIQFSDGSTEKDSAIFTVAN